MKKSHESKVSQAKILDNIDKIKESMDSSMSREELNYWGMELMVAEEMLVNATEQEK